MFSKQNIYLTILVSAQLVSCGSPSNPRYGSVANGSNVGGAGGTGGSAPAAPSVLTAMSPSASQVTLSWADNSNNETSFRVERAFATAGPFSTGVGAFTALKEVGANVKTFTDSQLQPSTLYYYRIVALNGVLPSSPSNSASATTQAAPATPPSPPSSLAATATAATVIALNWTDGSNNESYFEIERSTNNGANFSLIGTASADVRSYQDINLNPSSNYVYRVRARNFIGTSNFSNNGAVTTPTAGNTASYSYIAANIIGPNCVDCHGPSLASAGYNFSTYNLFNGNRNAAMNAINGGRMPPGAPLTSAQLGILNSWIAIGAPNN